LQDNVDALDEARDVVLLRTTLYQQNLKNYHSCRVRPRSFKKGDLVLRLKQDGHDKLESPWVGPYIVQKLYQVELIDFKIRKLAKTKATLGTRSNTQYKWENTQYII
jgi:hypothetical protein